MEEEKKYVTTNFGFNTLVTFKNISTKQFQLYIGRTPKNIIINLELTSNKIFNKL